MLDEQSDIWTKISGAEFSLHGPPFDGFVAVVRPVVERYPDRVLWGTDWPHTNMEHRVPDDGELVDLIPRIAPTAELQAKLLVTNPDAALLAGRNLRLLIAPDEAIFWRVTSLQRVVPIGDVRFPGRWSQSYR